MVEFIFHCATDSLLSSRQEHPSETSLLSWRAFLPSWCDCSRQCSRYKRYSRDSYTILMPFIVSAQTSVLVDSTYARVCKRRVKDFIGRESQLQKIQLYFSDQGAEQPRILILQALGGQGKSQIVLEYCRQFRSTYRGIFWVNGNSETTVIQSFESLAAELSEGSILVSVDA
jgi:hypothetical protein